MRKNIACGAILAAAFCTPVAAQPQVSGQLGQCMGIFGAVERLACYDRVAHSVNPMGPSQQPAAAARPAPQYAPAPAAQYVAPAAPAYAAAPVPASTYPAAPVPASQYPYAPQVAVAAPVAAGAAPAAQTRAAQFGGEYLAPAGGAHPVNAIESQIQSFRFTTGHRFVLQLENGQEWKQIEGDTGRPILTSLKTRSVTISRGALGSYNLVFSDQSGSYKVERTL